MWREKLGAFLQGQAASATATSPAVCSTVEVAAETLPSNDCWVAQGMARTIRQKQSVETSLNSQIANTKLCRGYFETFIKGSPSDGTQFQAYVPQAYRNVQVSMNALSQKGGGSQPLETQTPYDVLCFAEDDWVSQALHSVA